MSRLCEITGKRPMSGHNVSHSKRRTKRRFLPNVQRKRFYLESQRRWITLRVSTQAMREIDIKGIDAVLVELGVLKQKGNAHGQ